MLRGFVVVIVGGLGDIRGAVIAGLLLGVIEVLTAAYLSSGLKEAVAFLILVAVLWTRPQGLFGQAVVRRDVMPSFSDFCLHLPKSHLRSRPQWIVSTFDVCRACRRAAFAGAGGVHGAGGLFGRADVAQSQPAIRARAAAIDGRAGAVRARRSAYRPCVSTGCIWRSPRSRSARCLRAIYLNVGLFGGALGLSGIPERASFGLIYGALVARPAGILADRTQRRRARDGGDARGPAGRRGDGRQFAALWHGGAGRVGVPRRAGRLPWPRMCPILSGPTNTASNPRSRFSATRCWAVSARHSGRCWGPSC